MSFELVTTFTLKSSTTLSSSVSSSFTNSFSKAVSHLPNFKILIPAFKTPCGTLSGQRANRCSTKILIQNNLFKMQRYNDSENSNMSNGDSDEETNEQGFMAPPVSKRNGHNSNSHVLTPTDTVPMQSYMKIVNKLQAVLRNLENDGIKIPTPRIAVVGGQSTGKSSLLEQIAGDIFLPRGTGMVTKCPVILQFITSETKSYLVDGTEYNDAKGVERAIKTKSEFAARRDGGISNDPITVEISLPTAPNMTLVDLPGLIQVAANDQDSDLPVRIQEMVLEQIENNQTIILAVASADADFQNSESIKLAQAVDPQGDRTIAVVTKLDKIDLQDDEEKQSLRKTLMGSNVTVKLGVVGVVNRTKKLSFEDAKKNEAAILKKYFQDIAAKHGTEYLCNHLSKLQMQHIQDTLHSAMREVEVNHRQQLAILDRLGNGEVVDKQETLKRVAMKFASDYKQELEGGNRHVNIDSLCGSVIIKEILGPKFAAALDNLESENQATNERIVNAIYNHRGVEGFKHLAEMAYESVAPFQVQMLEADSLKSLDAVYLVMRDQIPDNCFSSKRSDGSSQANKYPKLQNELKEVIQKLLARPSEEVKEKIKDYIQTQAYTSRTYNPGFQNELDSTKTHDISLVSPELLAQMHEKVSDNCQAEELEGQEESGGDTDTMPILNGYGYSRSANLSYSNSNSTPVGERNGIDNGVIERVRYLVMLYFNIVKAQVMDHIPKIIKKHLIYHTSENLSNTMMDFCHKATGSHKESTLIRESDEIIRERKETQEKIKNLEDALRGFKDIKMMLEGGIDG